jgi:peptide chain release factor 3
LPFYKACWLGGDKTAVANFAKFKQANIVEDKDGNSIYLAQSEWYLNTEIANNKDIHFYFTSEMK